LRISPEVHSAVFPAVAADLDYAQKIMRKLKDAGAYRDPGLMMVVKCETGRAVLAIPFN
jgi:hypothetical protein